MNRSAGIFTASSEGDSVGTLCRLCMKNNDYYYNIFTSNVACRITAKDAINGLLGLEVAVGDGLPTTLCPLCLKKLTELSVFKMTCLESDAKLRNFSGINCFRSIQWDEATDDELGSSADTKDFIEDEIQGTSHLTHSVQRTEIYIPVPDSRQFRDNMLVTVKEEDKDPLSEGNYPVMCTPNLAGMSSNCLDPLATDDLPTVMENWKLIQNRTMAMVSMLETEESPAPGRASALFSVLEPEIRASNSRKGKEVMDKDINKRDFLLADKITSCSIPYDGQLHSKCRYAYKIGGDRATMIIAGKRGGCDNAETMKFFRSTENGNNSPETIIGENKVKSTCMIKYPGKRASSTKKSYHCFICRDVFNAKRDLIIHLKIHFGSGKLDIDSNLSVGKDLSLKTVVSSRETNSSCHPISSKSLNQLMCKSQGVRQKGNRLLKENFLGTRENKSVEEVRRSFIVGGKSCTASRHTAKKPYSCGECDKSFSERSTLVSHIRTHTKEKPYSCNECEKSFSDRSSFVRHMRIHTKEKPYSCNQCDKSFSDKSNLVSHFRTHTKEKPYSCNECDKSFSVRCNLVCHMRIHTKEKPYSCSQCDKSFSHKNTLVSHIRTHTKEKPYSCNECEKSYTSKQNLVLHMRVHRKEPLFLQ